MKTKSDTYQIASDIQWENAGEGVVRQIMAYDEHLMMLKGNGCFKTAIVSWRTI